jgi:alpha-N-arabinofuranosidase
MNLRKVSLILAVAFLVSIGLSFSSTKNSGEDTAKNTLIVDVDLGKEVISKNIYGHFSEHLGACIYGGYWVGEDSPIPNTRGIRKDVVEALKKIDIPVLRWPGGCFADEYHWKDGIGSKDKRPAMINTHWGRVTENNHFGTHEFLDLCEQLGCEPYICGNVGSGSVLEMQEWIEYITFDGESPMAELRRKNGREKPWKLRYFGVGNENWGCGGNMRPEFYADLYRRFQTYVRNFAGNRIYKIACGSVDDNYYWTEVLMREAGNRMSGLSYHYYTVPGGWRNKNSATKFGEAEWFDNLKRALRMDEYLTRHSTIMDRFDPEKRVGLIVDEWGNWYQVEQGTNPSFLYQQNSLRDALTAGLTMNIFNAHCDRVKMANIAQTINVLQAVILTKNEKMVLTPTYHVFDMYKIHQDAIFLPSELSCVKYEFEKDSIPAISASASREKDGKIHISLCNLDPNKYQTITCELRGFTPQSVTGRVLTSDDMTSHNTFENPERVKPGDFEDAKIVKRGLIAVLPPKSVVVLEVSK